MLPEFDGSFPVVPYREILAQESVAQPYLIGIVIGAVLFVERFWLCSGKLQSGDVPRSVCQRKKTFIDEPFFQFGGQFQLPRCTGVEESLQRVLPNLAVGQRKLRSRLVDREADGCRMFVVPPVNTWMLFILVDGNPPCGVIKGKHFILERLVAEEAKELLTDGIFKEVEPRIYNALLVCKEAKTPPRRDCLQYTW